MEKNKKTIFIKNPMMWRKHYMDCLPASSIFLKFIEKEKFVTMIRNFKVNKSTMIFKVNIVKLVKEISEIAEIIAFAQFFKIYFSDFKNIRKVGC